MLPKPPPREGSLGFLYLPPYRVQGISVAGEATSVMVPELDVVFDVGTCPRAALAMKYCAITHGHMDHIGGLAYYCSQRRFQGMGDANIVCDARIEPDIHGMMRGFQALERQKTPYNVIPLEPGGEIEIKNNYYLRGFETEHTSPSFGWTIVEKRSKLREEYHGLPQEKLTELKERGVEITKWLEIPLVAFTGDTLPGPHLIRDDVRKAHIVIAECTFFDHGHQKRAKVGQHIHIDDLAEWSKFLEAEHLVIVHVSRRTNMNDARRRLFEVLPEEIAQKTHLLMDFKTNRERYERQLEESGAQV
ncbi:MAG: MBL fold metallo-hydrolase [Planctomycetota bacterium]